MYIATGISLKYDRYRHHINNHGHDNDDIHDDDENNSSSVGRQNRGIFGDDSSNNNNDDNNNKKDNIRDKNIDEMNEIELFIHLSRQKYHHINQCIQSIQQRYRYRNIRKNYNFLKKELNKKKMMEKISRFVFMKVVKMRYIRIRKKVVVIQAAYRGI